MTATIVVWSHGLTLSLPWWLYVAALLLFSVTVDSQLCAAGGAWWRGRCFFSPLPATRRKLAASFWFGVIGLWLLIEDSRQVGN
jgi:hypothetical protein